MAFNWRSSDHRKEVWQVCFGIIAALALSHNLGYWPYGRTGTVPGGAMSEDVLWRIAYFAALFLTGLFFWLGMRARTHPEGKTETSPPLVGKVRLAQQKASAITKQDAPSLSNTKSDEPLGELALASPDRKLRFLIEPYAVSDTSGLMFWTTNKRTSDMGAGGSIQGIWMTTNNQLVAANMQSS
jgi:hypothetical protein